MNTRAGLVDPQLFHERVVEVALERPETGDEIPDHSRRTASVVQWWQPGREHPLVVLGDHIIDQPSHLFGLASRINPGTPDELAHLFGHHCDRIQRHPHGHGRHAKAGSAAGQTLVHKPLIVLLNSRSSSPATTTSTRRPT